MKPSEYIPLNSWLANADMLYVDGRLLWLQIGGMGGGCILLWLSLEQMLKTLVFQKRIENGEFSSSDDKAVFTQLNAWGRSMGHELKGNLSVFEECYSGLLAQSDFETLERVFEFFNRRYVVNTSSGIAIDLLFAIDSLYFKLRDLINDDLPVAFIDEVAIRKEHGHAHALEDYMKFAYIKNPSFRKRKHYRT